MQINELKEQRALAQAAIDNLEALRRLRGDDEVDLATTWALPWVRTALHYLDLDVRNAVRIEAEEARRDGD